MRQHTTAREWDYRKVDVLAVGVAVHESSLNVQCQALIIFRSKRSAALHVGDLQAVVNDEFEIVKYSRPFQTVRVVPAAAI